MPSTLKFRMLVLMCLLICVALALPANTQTAPAGNVVPQQAQAPVSPPPPTPNQSDAADLVVGSGDLLQVSVYGAQDFDKLEVRVDDNGNISLPLIGQVKVSGLTIHEAATVVQKKLADGGFFNDPQVSIMAKEYATQGISVLGEVQKPGIYPLLGPRSLFDAISAAGGTTPKAGNTVTITHRGRPQQPETVQLTYGGEGKPSTSNVPVLPGDTVVVSKAGVVYVVGDVRLPSGIIMDNAKLTVLQAIAMAQGTNPTAALNSAKLIRNSGTDRKEIPLPLKDILSAKAPDMPVQADDIIFVPASVGKSVAKRSLEAIVQAATGIAIYSRRY